MRRAFRETPEESSYRNVAAPTGSSATRTEAEPQGQLATLPYEWRVIEEPRPLPYTVI